MSRYNSSRRGTNSGRVLKLKLGKTYEVCNVPPNDKSLVQWNMSNGIIFTVERINVTANDTPYFIRFKSGDTCHMVTEIEDFCKEHIPVRFPGMG